MHCDRYCKKSEHGPMKAQRKGLLSPWGGVKMVKKGQERDESESYKAKRN